jgi:phosphoglucomutase
MEDYRSQKMLDAGFPSSDVLRFMMKDGSWVAVRPSGTEPKCKFYFSIVADDVEKAQQKLKDMRKTFEKDC